MSYLHLLSSFFSLISAVFWFWSAMTQFKGKIISVIGGALPSLGTALGGSGQPVTNIGFDKLEKTLGKQSKLNAWAAIFMAVSIILSFLS